MTLNGQWSMVNRQFITVQTSFAVQAKNLKK